MIKKATEYLIDVSNLESIEIDRIVTYSGYVFRVFYVIDTYKGKKYSIGTVLGTFHHRTDVDHVKLARPYSFICKDKDDALSKAEIYVGLDLDLRVLGRLSSKENYLTYSYS